VFFFMAKNIREYDHSVEYALQQNNRSVGLSAEKDFSQSGPKGCYYFVSLPDEVVPMLVARSPHDAPFDAGGIAATRFFPSNATEAFVPEKTKETVFVPEKITRNSRVYWGDVLRLFSR
jgi:hypothetical protein